MIEYLYKVRESNGSIKTGIMSGSDRTEVASKLQSSGYYVVDIHEKTTIGNEAKKGGTNLFNFEPKIKKADIIVLTRQLAAMSSSGIPITTVLKTVSEQIRNKRLSLVILDIRDKIESGTDLSEAMAQHPDVFTPIFYNMVKMGEASGNLDEVLTRIVNIEEEGLSIVNKVKAAVTYPIVLFTVALGVVGFILVFILPKFVGTFDTYDAELPMATKVLLNTSLFVEKYWVGCIIGVASLAIWFFYYIRRPVGKKKFDEIMLKLPIFGALILKIHVSRFARAVSGLLSSGIPLITALDIAANTEQNTYVKESLGKIRFAITGGESFSQTMKETGLFPSIVVQMVAAGEASGQLDRMLVDLSRFYDNEVDAAIKSMTILLEPVLLIFVGGMVAFMALSVLLPIFNLIKVFRN